MNPSLLLRCGLLVGILFFIALTEARGDANFPVSKNFLKCIEEGPYVEISQSKISLHGYLDVGYTYNFIGGGSAINNRFYQNDGRARGDLNLNCLQLILEKPLTQENTLQAGFIVSLRMGEDASDLGTNNEESGESDSFNLQQAAILLRLPYGNGIDLTLGKWVAPIGYEYDERWKNPNITLGNVTMVEPSWCTGVLATYKLSDSISLGAGVGNGEVLDNAHFFETGDDAAAFTAYVNISSQEKNAAVQVGFHIAPWGDEGYAIENEPVYIFNLFADWAPLCCKEKLGLGFNTSVGLFDDFEADDSSTFWGAALYAKYKFSDLINLAGRAEYVHTDDDQFLELGEPHPGSSDLWSLTSTLGFDVAEDFLVRCEYRVDWGDDLVAHESGTSDGPAHTACVEVVYKF